MYVIVAGPPGPPGDTGATGQTGPRGWFGRIGPPGYTGMRGYPGYEYINTGPPFGVRGPPGDAGATGWTGYAVTGTPLLIHFTLGLQNPHVGLHVHTEATAAVVAVTVTAVFKTSSITFWRHVLPHTNVWKREFRTQV